MEPNIFVDYNRFAPAPVFLDPIDVVKDPYAPDPLPPVYLPPTKDYAAPPVVPDNQVQFTKGFVYSGQVRDAVSELPLPSATVRVYAGGNLLDQAIADANGNFQITTQTQADSITISEAEHNTFNWPASEVQHTFDLERKAGDLPPVILPPVTINKSNAILWIVAAAVIAKSQKWI